MSLKSLLPLAASALSLVYAFMVFNQFRTRKKMHQLVWTVSFLLFTFAAFAEFYSEVAGWNPTLYRFYYVSAASLVAFMGAGTVYLLANRALAHGFLAIIVAVTLTMLWKALGAQLLTENFVAGVTVAGKAMPSSVRIFSPILTIPGTLALVGGALMSWWRTRTVYNLFIAAGAFIIAGSGSMARLGQAQFLYLGEMVGIVVLFYGFMRSREVSRKPRAMFSHPKRMR